MRSRATVIALAALAALGLACGSGTSGTKTEPGAANPAAPAKTPVVATVNVGQPLTLNREFLGSKVVATITVSNPRVVKAPNQFQKPEKGQFLVVDVSVQVVEGKFSLSQGSFKLVGVDGTVFDTTLPVVKPDLGFSELSPGQKTSGAVTFDTAANAHKGAKVALTDIFAQGDAGYWQIG